MLDHEPEGGERAGTQPAAETAETTTGAAGAADIAGSTPVRRTRTTRRRTTPATTEPAPTGVPAEAPTEARTVSGEAPEAEVTAPVAGDTEPAPKATRRRRKATPAAKADVPGSAADQAVVEVSPEPVRSAAEPVEPAAPVKVTRTRRKKAVPAAAQPEAGSEPTPPGTPAEPAVSAAADTVPAPSGRETAGTPVDPVISAPSGTTDEPAEGTTRSRRRRAALSAPTVLFMAPEPEVVPVRPKSTQAAAEPAEPAEPVPSTDTVAEVEAETGEGETTRRRRRRRSADIAELPVEPEAATIVEPAVDEENAEDDDGDEDDEAGARRRRRRGRRGRGRGKGGADEADDEETEEPAEAEADDEEADGDEGMTRRRRRRRRKGVGEAEPVTSDDGVPTVVKIREPRRTADEVQGVSGSTRLEAKRQRRRDGREQRRTRPPILSESEFLARREAVDRVMVVRQRGDRTQIGVLEDGILVEHYVTRASSGTMAGNVYLGKVQNVLPSMEAAFVDIGRGRNAVLYAGEVNWDSSGLEGRARSIEQALRSGDSVLVQVTKDPIGHKGARLTSHIALSGRHLVYVPHGNASGISRKLPDTERKRLRDILKKLVPDGAGVIVRTAAEGASEDELARDVKRLQAQWEDIQVKATEGGAPVLLYEEPDLVIRVVRDLFNEDFRELVVQGDGAYDMVESYLAHVSPDLVQRLRRHTGTADIFAEKRIDEQILKGLDRKVFLPSGGHLVIDRTEAMTVVDVNTGKYTGAGGNLEETVTRNNLEAAEEIVRQLRLRDIGGIVVIDFIDMVLESNRELVLRRLTECLGRDRTKHQVTEITSLGLVQMTRKRIGAGLLEAFSEPCECCKGRGLIIHTEPVSEKPRNGGGERVKSVAATSGPPAGESGGAGGRRRNRRNTEPAVTPAAAPAAESVEVEVVDEDDTMGYDLSRYEVRTPAVTEPDEPTSMRLASADDPDAVDGEAEPDEEPTDAAAGGRRRSRRAVSRRRTRP